MRWALRFHATRIRPACSSHPVRMRLAYFPSERLQQPELSQYGAGDLQRRDYARPNHGSYRHPPVRPEIELRRGCGPKLRCRRASSQRSQYPPRSCLQGRLPDDSRRPKERDTPETSIQRPRACGEVSPSSGGEVVRSKFWRHQPSSRCLSGPKEPNSGNIAALVIACDSRMPTCVEAATSRNHPPPGLLSIRCPKRRSS